MSLFPEAFSRDLTYLKGLGSIHQTEAVPDALPKVSQAPKKHKLGLHYELFNGTTFTMPRARNQKSLLYRIHAPVDQGVYTEAPAKGRMETNFSSGSINPGLRRWKAFGIPDKPTDFVEGMHTCGGCGDSAMRSGYAVHWFEVNKSMEDKAFVNADGDYLIVVQQGHLYFQTEFGILDAQAGEIVVIPRGIMFAVHVKEAGRGYICESFQGHYQLPELGPLGSTGLANPAHFEFPTAAFEDRTCKFEVVHKHLGGLYTVSHKWSPFNVVAWSGNYAPYKYNLYKFNACGSVTYDHMDPSLHTVLTVPSAETGAAVVDFVAFVPRWDASTGTYRPPPNHRNHATEFNGIIKGAGSTGYQDGGSFLSPFMTPHGLSGKGAEANMTREYPPTEFIKDSLWVMFESSFFFRTTAHAEEAMDPLEEYQERFKGQPDFWQGGKAIEGAVDFEL